MIRVAAKNLVTCVTNNGCSCNQQQKNSLPLFVHLRRDGGAWLIRFEDPAGRIRRNWTENWFLPVPRRRAPFRYLLWKILELARERGLLDDANEAILVLEGPMAEVLRGLRWSHGGRRRDREELLKAAEAIKHLAAVYGADLTEV